MEGNTTGKIRFVGIEVPFISEYISIYPFDMEGHLSVIVKSVLEKFNWNYEEKLAEGFPKFNMTEVFEYLVRNESDVAFYPNPLDYKDFGSIDYSHVTKDSDNVIISSTSSASFESSDFAFVYIYSFWVWLAWVISFFFLAVFWSLAENTPHQAKHSTKYQLYYEIENVLTRQMLNTYRVSLNQSANLPRAGFWHQRLAVGCWIIGSLVINAGFTGGLLSKMTLPPKMIYIETYGDILKHPNTRVIVIKHSGIEKSLKGSTDHLRRQIWQQILRYDTDVDVHNFNVDEIFKKIVGGEAIFIYDELRLKEIFSIVISCDDFKMLQLSRESVYKAQFAFPLKKNLDSRKARIVRRTLQSLFEADIIQRSNRFECWKNSECFLRDPIPPKKLNWWSVRVVCYSLLLGYLISTMALIFELPYHTGIKTQKKRNAKDIFDLLK